MPGAEAEAPSQDGGSERLSKPAAQAQASETPPWLGVPAPEWAHAPAPPPPSAGSRELVIWPGIKKLSGLGRAAEQGAESCMS